MSALSDRMAGMTRKQAHELNDREAINEFDRLAAEREREDAPPLKERQASWGETREELIALRAELSALKARRCDGCAHWCKWDLSDDGECGSDAYNLNGTDLAPTTEPGHSCAAWTEKP